MVDLAHLREAQAPHSRPGVDQNILIDQERCCAEISADTAAASENLESHGNTTPRNSSQLGAPGK
jgi:hypothetical protein